MRIGSPYFDLYTRGCARAVGGRDTRTELRTARYSAMVDVQQEDIIVALDKAQTSTVTHAKFIKTLRALHDQTDLHEFLHLAHLVSPEEM